MSILKMDYGTISGKEIVSAIADTTQEVGSITTRGGSFVDYTQDIVVLGYFQGSVNCYLTIDGSTISDSLISAGLSNTQCVIGNSTLGIGMLIPKGHTISTRTDAGTYNIHFYKVLDGIEPIPITTPAKGETIAHVRNTSIVINTGITNLKHFVWMAKCANSNYIQTVEYHDDIFPNKYSAGCVGTSASVANQAFGSFAQNVCMLASDTDIATGYIVISTYNSTYGDVDAGVWYAE